MIALPDVPPGSRLRTPAGDVYLLTAAGWSPARWGDRERAALARAIRAAIESEPGEWSPTTLAEDHGVSTRAIRHALASVPHSRRRGGVRGMDVRLYPPGWPSREDEARALLARGPMTTAALGRAVGLTEGTSVRRLAQAIGARVEGGGRSAVWVLA